MGAQSPLRKRVLSTLVYPPHRSAKRGARSTNTFFEASLVMTKPLTRRRATNVCFLPRVMMRSAMRRNSFAFATVVSMRSCSMREVTWLRNSAFRCELERDSFRSATLCFIVRGCRAMIKDGPPAHSDAEETATRIWRWCAGGTLDLEWLDFW